MVIFSTRWDSVTGSSGRGGRPEPSEQLHKGELWKVDFCCCLQQGHWIHWRWFLPARRHPRSSTASAGTT